MLGDRRVVRPQFEATKEYHDTETAAFAALGADEHGREQYQGGQEIMQPAHYDGFGFGDVAPDHMFLWCERPCGQGGASFLVDGLQLVDALTAKTIPSSAVASGRSTSTTRSPTSTIGAVSPVARFLPGGRVQVQAHPCADRAAGPNGPRSRRWWTGGSPPSTPRGRRAHGSGSRPAR